MAARSPTTFTKYSAFGELQPNKNVITTTPSGTTDDQQYCVDRNRLLLSDCFAPIAVDSGSYVIVRRYYFQGRHACESAAAAFDTVEFSILAWASDASNFTVALYDARASGDVEYAISSNHTDKLWRGAWTPGGGRTLTAYNDETETEVHLKAKRTSGSGIIYVAGVCVFY